MDAINSKGGNAGGGWDVDSITTEDAEMLAELFSKSDDETCMIKDHDVVLKIVSCPTKGTRIWKEKVRFLLGTRKLSREDIEALSAMQNSFYRHLFCCSKRYNDPADVGSTNVSFWVSLKLVKEKKQIEWVLDMDDVRHIKIGKELVPVVPASDDCIRDEIFLSKGISTLERNAKIKCKKKQRRQAAALTPSVSQQGTERGAPTKPAAPPIGEANDAKCSKFASALGSSIRDDVNAAAA
ncbi:expressed unknown protein [Seminavis robusta]|uniref:Uncharacterized protein n=1 Tax=Seminavis robusta TaxID=568900 RepID=A0A9N8H9N7_9STRA|nr:expressed unknown protein [Seminavis robusta]|eukprot:Sro213_g088410.1 n/a (239) ;mRNA; f:36245-36961